MKVELKLLSKIKEVQLYPGVLARIGTGKDSIPVELLLRDVLEKELEPPVSAETVVDLLLETGETEAARALDTLLQSEHTQGGRDASERPVGEKFGRNLPECDGSVAYPPGNQR